MKKIYSLISLVLIVTTSFGQSKQSEKADKLFESYQYIDAIDAYLELVNNNQADGHVYNLLAESYYNVFNIVEASKWYAKAVETNQGAETYYRYSQTLKSLGKYEAANRQMDVFSQMMPNDQRAKDHKENPNYIPQLADKAKLFDAKEVTINKADQSDFGAILSNDNILYFVSTRNEGKKQDSWTKKPYLDIYQSVRNADGKQSEPESVSSLNTPYHDGPITLSTDGNTMYFARDGHSEGTFKKIKNKNIKLAQQGIFKATLVKGKWGNIQPLPINNMNYSVSHPSLSSDGKTLYFTSNKPGGLGDTDIWKVRINGDAYGEPENLGSNVNTAGKEGFPFISDNSILYFASSGKQGFGGYDIFKFDLTKNEGAINLGKPINTKSDDFSFSINTSKKVGYFASNRSGVDNIYTAIPICQFETIAVVKDLISNDIIAGASVSILDADNNNIATQSTEENGKTNFNVKCGPNYVLNISKEGYESTSMAVNKSVGENVIMDISLNPINEIITETEVKLKNIYFEFNKSNITQQGAFELDKLIKIMNDYPDMKIFVRSHTDSKGGADYNLKLSNERAQATVQYVISKGINKDRLSAIGMGSNEPIIDCKSNNCTDEEDAQNRRSEFLIIKD